MVGHFVADEIKAFALLLAMVAADRATGKDPDRRGAYALAVVAGAAAGTLLAFTAGPVVLGVVLEWDGPTPPSRRLVLHIP